MAAVVRAEQGVDTRENRAAKPPHSGNGPHARGHPMAARCDPDGKRPEVNREVPMRSLVLLFFATTTFLLGSLTVDAELARTGSFQAYLGVIWAVTIVGSIAFLVAAAIFARRGSST
jgi:hypothetical protein